MKIEDVIEKFKAEYDLSKNVNFPHNFEANYAYFDSNWELMRTFNKNMENEIHHVLIHNSYYRTEWIKLFKYDDEIEREYKFLLFDTDYEKIPYPATRSVYTLNGKSPFKKSTNADFNYEYPSYYEGKIK